MALFSFLFGSEKNKSVFLIDTHELKKAVTQHNVQLIDVRTPNEYSSGHIDKAINIDFFNQNGFKAAFSKPRPANCLAALLLLFPERQ